MVNQTQILLLVPGEVPLTHFVVRQPPVAPPHQGRPLKTGHLNVLRGHPLLSWETAEMEAEAVAVAGMSRNSVATHLR